MMSVMTALTVGKKLRRHKPLLLNLFQAREEFSAGCVEGLNGKAKLRCKKPVYSSRTMWRKSHSCIHPGGRRPHKSPTDSAEKAFFFSSFITAHRVKASGKVTK